ncbi:MAG: hypothetical protein HYS60_00050 [Candidatus Wildermuthbacteria bacterium]|nr:hypothetical protein [Candidatus Wildermuthbacteria bacterium]
MKFTVELKRGSISSALRDCGYAPLGIDPAAQELIFVKSLGRMYPRFHIYCKAVSGSHVFALNLHLDQKRPTYQGVSAHSGEYEGSIVEAEAKRISSTIHEAKPSL